MTCLICQFVLTGLDSFLARFATGDVAGHHLYSVTSKSLLQLLLLHEPEVHLVEQVKGFTMPIEAGSPETPKDRPVCKSKKY